MVTGGVRRGILMMANELQDDREYVLFDDVEELDATSDRGRSLAMRGHVPGPTTAGGSSPLSCGDGQPVRAAKGLVLTPDRLVRRLVPATCRSCCTRAGRGRGASSTTMSTWAGCRRWRQAARPRLHDERVHGVASRAAKAGLLAGIVRRPTATGAPLDPAGRVSTRASRCGSDDRYVDSGEVITSAGVSAGIDMALHLVVRLAGEERARGGPPVHPVRPAAARLIDYSACSDTARWCRLADRPGYRRASG